VILVALALAGKPAIPGRPGEDGCDPAGLRTALDSSDFGVFAGGVLAACPGLPPEVGEWFQARMAGASSPRAAMVCPRAKGDLKRAVSPGFDARMKGVQKSCKIRGWDVREAVGPGALLLGWAVSQRLQEGGIPGKLAEEVGHRLAGIEGGRMDGRYGSFAARADHVVLPEAHHVLAPLPVVGEGQLWLVDGRSEARVIAGEAAGGGWLAVLPEGGALGENAPVHGVQFAPSSGPASLRLAVSSTEVRLAFGAAGAEVEARGRDAAVAIEGAREALFAAQEFGGSDVPPDHVWVQPVGDVTVARVVKILDLLHHEDGTPRFDILTLGLEGEMAEWPERIDASGL
jgi:hypothetical protein